MRISSVGRAWSIWPLLPMSTMVLFVGLFGLVWP